MADIPKQFQMTFNAEQDRMLLRINTAENAEYRLWLTRHMVRAMWDGLLKVFESAAETDAPFEAATREAILGFDHKVAVEQADFKTPFKEAANSFPLGEEGVLVTSLGIGRSTENVYTLKLSPRKGSGINVNLNDKLMHSFMQLLIDSEKQAAWGLGLKFPAADADSPAENTTAGKVLRH